MSLHPREKTKKSAFIFDIPAILHTDITPQLKLLRLFKSEFESLRSLLTCKICYCILYEPYTTSCGHTYCYVVGHSYSKPWIFWILIWFSVPVQIFCCKRSKNMSRMSYEASSGAGSIIPRRHLYAINILTTLNYYRYENWHIPL